MSDQTNSDANVTIYSTVGCAFCATEKQWLDKLGVKYTAKNIDEDKSAEKELLDKLGGTYQGVPTTVINGEVIIGFNRPALQTALTAGNLIPQAS